MAGNGPLGFDCSSVPTPCYIVDAACLRRNAETMAAVQAQTGCRILLALKGFAMHAAFPLLRQYLVGVCASSVAEAQLGADFFGGELHAYAPAYNDDEMTALLPLVDHLSFNSIGQWRHFRDRLAPTRVSCGLRINPQYSEVEVDLYNPCGRRSRLGVLAEEITAADLDGIDGLHFHTMCEQNSDVLARTLAAVEARFGAWLGQMKWVNFGGGHHLTRADYDLPLLCRLVSEFADRYEVQVYLEPGEAVALNAGVLVASVLDILHREIDIAVLDTSATAHMPDVLEMPYRPQIVGAGDPAASPYRAELAGLTCLAGDVIGEYGFPAPLQIGQRLVFLDMAHYTMVKNSTFNGVRLPAIALVDADSRAVQIVRQFGYADYRDRLS